MAYAIMLLLQPFIHSEEEPIKAFEESSLLTNQRHAVKNIKITERTSCRAALFWQAMVMAL
jgi:hypothetical protein